MNDHVIQADQDIQEPQSYNSVWQLDIEIDPPLASGLDPDDLEDDPKGPKRTFKYWLKIKDDFPLPQNEPAVHKPTFVPLPFPFKRTNDPYKWGLLTLEDWNIYCQRTVSPSVPWSNTFRPKNSSLGDRTLRVRYGNLGVDTWDYNDKTPTKYNGSTTKYEGDNKDWAAFYDFLLEQGQNLSHINSDADIQQNFDQIELQWNKPKVKDSRDYDVVKGFGFVPKRWGGQAAPKLLRDTRYVKLLGGASSAGRALIENDNGAQARGVRQHHIYLEESAINSLVSGNYDWPGSGYCVTTRTEEGGIQYIDCADSNLANSRRPGSTIGKSTLQKPQFWKKAMDSGLSVKAQRPLRSRNVGELDMVLVVQERAMPAVSKEQLEGVIKKAKLEAKIPIKQNDCRVLTNKEKDASPGFTNKYLLVATSPFGHYETWISKVDYISYFQAYPPYPMPDQQTLSKIKDKLKSAEANVTGGIKAMDVLNKNWEDLSTKAAQQNGIQNDKEVGISVGIVSMTSMNAAGKPKARQSEVTQKGVMGISATKIAKIAGWPKSTIRLSGVKDAGGKIVWDSPSVFPAEWLHRSAFSWGNETTNNGLTQRSSNLVFGSSETNSKMTRYEKAWQQLFYIEKGISDRMGEQNSSAVKKVLSGALITRNTSVDAEIVQLIVDNGAINEKVYKSSSRSGSDVDYWTIANEIRGLSFSLGYNLALLQDSGHMQVTPLGGLMFFPFQRGFFTRLEADVDYLLLKHWAQKAIAKYNPPQVSEVGGGNTNVRAQPLAVLPSSLCSLTVNPITTRIISASPSIPLVAASSHGIFSPLTIESHHARLWESYRTQRSITIGGQALRGPSTVSLDHTGKLMKVDVKGMPEAIGPLNLQSFHAFGTDSKTKHMALFAGRGTARAEEVTADNIPDGFVLNGMIKVFNIIDAQVYVFSGHGAHGQWQIVPLHLSVALSTFVPELMGQPFDSVQLSNVQMAYHEYSTLTEASGTWLEADVSFSGTLQPISTFLHDVLGQKSPRVRMQALLSQTNDWAFTLRPDGLSLRGSLPNVSVKLGDVLNVVDLGMSFMLKAEREAYAPYNRIWKHTIGFFGKVHIDMPNNIAAVTMDFSIVEDKGVLIFSASAGDDPNIANGFAGVAGLRLAELSLTTAFLMSKSPSMLLFQASASLALRDSVLELVGFYAKSDWALSCEMHDFDFANLRDMYEDLFGGPLHLTRHEVVFKELALIATPSGLTISGHVTVEGHASAAAVITMKRTGLYISGQVGDVMLSDGIVLKEAAIDIFIGQQQDTEKEGPGTSFKFAVTGKVEISGQQISATLFLDRNSKETVNWTLVGSFNGVFGLASVAPALKGTFMDMSLGDARLIISNTDKVVAAGAFVPASYPVVKGVQIAASLSSLPALDHTLGTPKQPTPGLILQAIYDAKSKSFGVSIMMPNQRTISFNNGSVYSGPLTLQIDFSPTPTLRLKADFFVKVSKGNPLKFSGAFSLDVKEARLSIELKDQYWIDPFGLSPKVKLGPDLALQIGVVYVGPVYPSDLGVAAGLTVGDVSGKAALLVSELPEDELIKFEVDNLGITDVVKFASLLLEEDIPQPNDFLRFKKLKLYLSTGVTIGTILYPAGASFSCDALIFGHEVSVECAVDKSKKLVQVKGSLQAIDIGPLSIAGFDQGKPLRLDVEIGPGFQTILFDGGVRILDFQTRVYIDAELLPLPKFHLKAELRFSEHLVFNLEAMMQGDKGFSGGVSELKTLSFYIHFFFHQDILDHIVAQIHAQILTAKHAVDDGIHTAQETLDKAQKDYDASVEKAQEKVDQAKTAYDASIRKAQGKLEEEKATSRIRTEKLQKSLDDAIEVFNKALEIAVNELRSARDVEKVEIDKAKQKVDDAQRTADSDIDEHLKKVNNAKDDMQRRFGDAVNKIQHADDEVKSCERRVAEAQRHVDEKRAILDGAAWYNKIGPGLDVAGAEIELVSVKGALEIADGVLKLARDVVEDVGYKAAKVTIEEYENLLRGARTAADKSLGLVKSGLQETIDAQSKLVSAAEIAEREIRESGVEKLAVDDAKRVLQEFQQAEASIISGLEQVVHDVAKGVEAATLDLATKTLTFARANSQAVDTARNALSFAQTAVDAALDVSDWVITRAINILNIREIEVTGDLGAVCERKSKLKARITGTFAEHEVDVSIDFTPGDGEELIKELFKELMDKVKSGIISIAKHH